MDQKALTLADTLFDDVLNGDIYAKISQGETYRPLPENRAILTGNSYEGKTTDEAKTFLAANYAYMVAKGIPSADAASAAMLRFIAFKAALIGPEAGDGELTINEWMILPRQENRDEEEKKIWQDLNATFDLFKAALPTQNKNLFNDAFCDVVCMVAFVFRSKGHHYTDKLENVYSNLWRKTTFGEKAFPTSWKTVATTALHCIKPTHLEKFWEKCCNKSCISGALKKRYDTAAAGTSGAKLVISGVEQIKLMAPQLLAPASDQVAYVMELKKEFGNDKLKGSINARYYGKDGMSIDESRLSILANVIIEVSKKLSSQSTVAEAPSLKRIASIAQIAGGIMKYYADELMSKPKELVERRMLEAPRELRNRNQVEVHESGAEENAEEHEDENQDE